MEITGRYCDFNCYEISDEGVRRGKSPSLDCCPMCLRPTLKTAHFNRRSVFANATMRGYLIPSSTASLFVCRGCGWWALNEDVLELEIQTVGPDYLFCGLLKSWKAADVSTPMGALRSYCAQHERQMERMALNPGRIEKIVSECLKLEYKPCEVRHIGTAKGRLVEPSDVYRVHDGQGEWLIQIQRRGTGGGHLIDAISELNGLLVREGTQAAIVVTGTPRLARDAEGDKGTKIAPPGPYIVRLVDRTGLFTLSEWEPSMPPWETALLEFDEQKYEAREVLSSELADLFWDPRAMWIQAGLKQKIGIAQRVVRFAPDLQRPS